MEAAEILWITLNIILIIYTITMCSCARYKIQNEKVINIK